MSLQLTALEPEDLELLYTIENDSDMWNVGDTNVPYSKFVLRDYIVNQQNDIYADKQLRLVIRVDEAKGNKSRAIGLIDLFNFDPRNMRAEMGLAMLKAEQGRGYATEAIRQLKDYAASILHLHQLYCIVPADNAPSLSMLRTSGFTHEHILADWLLTPEGWKPAIQLQCFL